MPASTPISAKDLLPLYATGWSEVNDGKAIRKVFLFRNFAEAFAFMTRVAEVAETLNHHPDWSNVWRKVTVELTTHSSGGLTSLDLELARQMDGLAGH